MNKKIVGTIFGVVVVAALVVGGIAIFHKSSKTTPSSSASTYTTSPSNKKPTTTTPTQTTTVNNAVLTTKTDSSVGSYLADSSGNALYTYSGDSSGVRNCTGSCLANWPAYKDTGATTGLPTNVSTIKRTDNGQTQYTYKGMPLYSFASDTKGQVTGNGVSGFAVAKP